MFHTAPVAVQTQPQARARFGAHSGAITRPFNVLILTDSFKLAYRVMRCFHAAGANVHVLGSTRSRGLRYSRFCKSFRYRANDYRDNLQPLIDEVNAVVIEHDIALIACGEHFMMRPLIVMAPALSAPCFPMLSIEQFDILNDKWRFTQLCNELGVRCPGSQLVADVAALRELLQAGKLTQPFIVKPVAFDGATGFFAFDRSKDLSQLSAIDYSPILVQEFIEGEDVCVSVYCNKGQILAFVAYRYSRATYITFEAPAIRADCAKILANTKANGVLNFEMRIAPDGAVYWLECNPRFFMSIAMSMLAGFPFVEYGLPIRRVSGVTASTSGAQVRFIKAAALEAVRFGRLTLRDFAYLRYVIADPIPWAREGLGFENRPPLRG